MTKPLAYLVEFESGCSELWLASEISGPPAFGETVTPLVAEREWQAIETCPEMRNVLLFAVTDLAEDGTVRNWKMGTGCKLRQDYPLNENETCWRWGEFRTMIWDAQPTHWQHLPEPPK